MGGSVTAAQESLKLLRLGSNPSRPTIRPSDLGSDVSCKDVSRVRFSVGALRPSSSPSITMHGGEEIKVRRP